MTSPPNSSPSHAGGGTLKPSDVLAKAADLIEPPGKWCQRSYGVTGGAQCLVGVLGTSMPRDMRWGELARPLKSVVGTSALINWNDAPDRTQAEVVAALRKASTLAREAGE